MVVSDRKWGFQLDFIENGFNRSQNCNVSLHVPVISNLCYTRILKRLPRRQDFSTLNSLNYSSARPKGGSRL